MADTHGTDLLTLVLNVSDGQAAWHHIAFEGESAAYVDQQAAAWVKDRPYLAIGMDEASTRWDLFPRTFDAVIRKLTCDQKLMQIHTL
ncbi:hypothetical protein [Streptomyces sp. MMS24-I29]|uniref:hypothetical protein n=1 Tax=Streptomyces sp. MMS24-I29 TaxID=3351480 RepID=UPI003C7E4E01